MIYNYLHKYRKYKIKYNNLKQHGGALYDEIYILYLLDDTIKVGKLKITTESLIGPEDNIKDDLVRKYQVSGIKKYIGDPNTSTFTKYIYYDRIVADTNVKKIIVYENSKIIMEHLPTIYKIFYIYNGMISLKINILEDKSDVTVTSGKGTFQISDDTIILNGTCDLTKSEKGIRNILMTIKELIISHTQLIGDKINNISNIDRDE